MKTLVFDIWKEPLEEFIRKIPLSENELNDWFDVKGAKHFEISQREYYLKHQEEFTQANAESIAYKQAREQLIAGFKKVFAEMKKDFSLENDTEVNKLCENFTNEAVSEKYAHVIAPRAPITSQYARMDKPTPKEGLEFTLAKYKELQTAVERKVAALEAYLNNIPKPVYSSPSSPTLHRQMVDLKITEDKSELQQKIRPNIS